MIQAGDKRMGAVPRQAAKGRLEAEHPAQRGGHANRSVGVASQGKMRQSGGDGGGRSAGGAASGALRIVRIARGAVMAVLGGEAVGVSIHVQHAAEQRASVAQLLHRPGVVRGGRAVAEQAGARQRRMACHVEQIFYRIRHAGERRQRLTFAPQPIEAIRLLAHTIGDDRGPGVKAWILLLNSGQVGGGNLRRAQLTACQRLAQLADREFMKPHA